MVITVYILELHLLNEHEWLIQITKESLYKTLKVPLSKNDARSQCRIFYYFDKYFDRMTKSYS